MMMIGTGTTPFTPVTNTYNSGSGTETIPTGANQVVIEAWGGGGNGGPYTGFQPGGGGGGGAYVKKTFTLNASNWGQTFNYAVGAAVNASTVSQNTFGTVVSLNAGAGASGQPGGMGGNPGAGGTASGGDVMNAGSSGSGSNGGAGASPGGGAGGAGGATPVAGTAPGGGGGGNTNAGSGASGASGRILFAYT